MIGPDQWAQRCAPRRPASLRQGQKYRRGRRLIPNDRTRRGCFREAYNLDPANLRRARAAAVGIIKYNVLFPSFTCTYNLTFLVSRSFILRPDTSVYGGNTRNPETSFFSETETEKCKTSDVQQTQEITKEHVHLRRASVRQLPTPTAAVPRCRPCTSRSSYFTPPHRGRSQTASDGRQPPSQQQLLQSPRQPPDSCRRISRTCTRHCTRRAGRA